MALQKMTCPSCGGELQIDSDKDFIFCTYCGTKIQNTTNQNIKIDKVERKIDEAEILRVKLEQEKFDAEKKAKKNKIKASLIASGAFITIGAVVFFVLGRYAGLSQILGAALVIVGIAKIFKTFTEK